MKQIYNFEGHRPPVLTEQNLKAMEACHQARRQALWVAAAGALMQVCMIIGGLLLWGSALPLALACFGYAALSLVGGGSIFYAFVRKGEELKWQTSQ